MTTTQANPQERIARELLTQSPGTFIGVDGDGAGHYWDSYERAVAVVPRDAESAEDAETFELDETPLATLGDWCEYVRGERGWEIGPHVGGSLVGDLAQAVDA
ncbi:hypothetical protein [Haloarcula laminariae]|uniref:hypothetical protein n=1 Tax=Haloarcula laminariae TaxID=2961577 RepID=UPI0021C8E075|nr:hypothetical protein [Halomicroarcula laminariae]